jgi:hypothetical protein
VTLWLGIGEQKFLEALLAGYHKLKSTGYLHLMWAQKDKYMNPVAEIDLEMVSMKRHAVSVIEASYKWAN